MAPVQEFDNYAPERFERLRDALAARGLSLPGLSGEVKAFGADVEYAYDATAQSLTLTVNKAPFLHSMTSFCAQLSQTVEDQT